ncbi:MAG TPA: site-2 protease family protein [Anaerolineales bacterium]|jgi:Zn-dependent protease|nr:site-2 protease family protein [Anaerolineales bacterium]
MLLFQSPPPTRYDLRFSIAGIPIRVHPLFWLLTLLLGAAGDPVQLLIWVLVVFVSIVVHELGHAFAMRYFGQSSHIVLHFAGGLAIPDSVQWGSRWANVALGPNQYILISLAGPVAGFILAGLAIVGILLSGGSVGTTWLFGLIPLPLNAVLPFGGRILDILVTILLWVNIFWGLINLLPVFPLDGGNVARNILVQLDPMNGVRKSLWVSVITGGLIALLALVLLRSIYMAFLFGLLAFQSYQSLQSRTMGM